MITIKYLDINFPIDMARHFQALDKYYDNMKKDGGEKDAYLLRSKREEAQGTC